MARLHRLRACALITLSALLRPATAHTADGSAAPEEELRLHVLRAVFPAADIGRLPSPAGAKHNRGDALDGEPMYSVRGPYINQAEDCAGEDVATGKQSLFRELRLRVLSVPGAADGSFVAVLQYQFPGVQPAGACWSLGMAVQLSATFSVQGEYLFRTWHHGGIGSIRLIDLAGDGHPHMVVESDWGGAGVAGSSFYVFDLRNSQLSPIFIAPSAVNGDVGIVNAELDIARTRLQKARSLCLIRKTIFDPEHPAPKPTIARTCYPAGFAVSEESDNQEWLKPRSR